MVDKSPLIYQCVITVSRLHNFFSELEGHDGNGWDSVPELQGDGNDGKSLPELEGNGDGGGPDLEGNGNASQSFSMESGTWCPTVSWAEWERNKSNLWRH